MASSAGVESVRLFVEIPRHPQFRVRPHLFVIALELGRVVEYVHLVEFTGVDQGHKEIAHFGTSIRFVEQRIVPSQDGLF